MIFTIYVFWFLLHRLSQSFLRLKLPKCRNKNAAHIKFHDKSGPDRESNQGPLAPKARIIKSTGQLYETLKKYVTVVLMRSWQQVCKQMIAPYRSSMLVTYSTFPVVVFVFVQSIPVIITGKCNSKDHDQLTFPTVVPERVVFSRYKWKVALAFHPYLVSRKTFGSIVVSILACHAGDRISFPIIEKSVLNLNKYLSETLISLFLSNSKS